MSSSLVCPVNPADIYVILPFSNYFYLNSLDCAICYLLENPQAYPLLKHMDTPMTPSSPGRKWSLHSYIAERTGYQKATSSTSFHYAETLLHLHPSSSHLSSCCINRWSSPCLGPLCLLVLCIPWPIYLGTLLCWLSVLSRVLSLSLTLDSPFLLANQIAQTCPIFKTPSQHLLLNYRHILPPTSQPSSEEVCLQSPHPYLLFYGMTQNFSSPRWAAYLFRGSYHPLLNQAFYL